MVKCFECGFLAKHSLEPNVPSPKFYEIDTADRFTGRTNEHVADSFRGPIVTEPVCFMTAFPIQDEILERMRLIEQVDGSQAKEVQKQVFNEDRACDQWIQYEHGYSPKEHLDDRRAAQLEQDRRNFEHELFALSQKVQEDSRDIAKSAHSFNKRITVIFICFVVLQVAIGLLSWFFKDGF